MVLILLIRKKSRNHLNLNLCLAPSVEWSNISTHHSFSRVRLIFYVCYYSRQQMRAIIPFHEKSSYLHIVIILYLTDVKIIHFSHLYTNITAVRKSQKDELSHSGIKPACIPRHQIASQFLTLLFLGTVFVHFKGF